jgi:hypothetical protein
MRAEIYWMVYDAARALIKLCEWLIEKLHDLALWADENASKYI